MSTKSEWAIQRIRRGARVAEVREAMKVSGDEFAEKVEKGLRAYGVERRYDKAKISRIEGGSRDLTAEEVMVIAELDPHGRGPAWLTFGEAHEWSHAALGKRAAGRTTARYYKEVSPPAASPARRRGGRGRAS